MRVYDGLATAASAETRSRRGRALFRSIWPLWLGFAACAMIIGGPICRRRRPRRVPPPRSRETAWPRGRPVRISRDRRRGAGNRADQRHYRAGAIGNRVDAPLPRTRTGDRATQRRQRRVHLHVGVFGAVPAQQEGFRLAAVL